MRFDFRSLLVSSGYVKLPLFLVICLGLIVLIARIPGGIYLLMPAIVFYCALFSTREHTVAEWALIYALALLTAFRVVSVVFFGGAFLDLVAPLLMFLVAVAVISFSASFRKVLGASLLAAFFLVIGLGAWEILSGQSLAAVRYPASVLSPMILQDRVVTSAFFPNYNDYSVVLFFAVAFILLKLLEEPLSPRRKILCIIAFTLLVTHGFYMGSRGFQLAVGFSIFLLFMTRLSGVWRILSALFVLLSLLGFVVIFSSQLSHYFFDVSTAIRLRAITVFSDVTADSPAVLILGFPSLSAYTQEMTEYCELCLVDPHNLLLEVLALHGLVGVLLLFSMLVYAFKALFLRPEQRYGVLVRYYSLLVLTSPVWGLISSSSLKYFYIYFFSILLVGLVASDRQRSQSSVRGRHDNKTGAVGMSWS